jgi:hypothetical protein
MTAWPYAIEFRNGIMAPIIEADEIYWSETLLSRTLWAKKISRFELADAKSAAQESFLRAIGHPRGEEMLLPLASLAAEHADSLQEKFAEQQQPQTIFASFEIEVV